MLNLQNFKTANRVYFINKLTQILLALSLLLALNLLSSKHYLRFNLTSHNNFFLSPETTAYLKKIDQPIDIFVTISPSVDLDNGFTDPNTAYYDVSHLLKEFKHATPEFIRLHFIDPYSQTQKLKELASRFPIHKENAIIFALGDKSQQISANDLYVLNKQDNSQEFKGEQIFVSSLFHLTQSKRQKIYFIQGHGEMKIDDVSPSRGFSQFAQFLQSLNFDIATLHLAQTTSIPQDADLIILSSPQTPLLPTEISELRSFLSSNKGQLLVLIDPHYEHGLDRLFADWGLLSDNLSITDPSTSTHTSNGNLILRNYASHPITEFLIDHELPLLAGFSRPIRPASTAPSDEKLSITPLIASSKSSWAEPHPTHHNSSEFDPITDLQGPLPIITLAERTIDSELGINIPGGRLIVFGNSDIISNNYFNSLGNKILFQNILNYTFNRYDLLHITPKKIQKYQLPLSEQNLLHIAFALSSLPLMVACAAIFVYLIRRK